LIDDFWKAERKTYSNEMFAVSKTLDGEF
jgi:hypothetical protein